MNHVFKCYTTIGRLLKIFESSNYDKAHREAVGYIDGYTMDTANSAMCFDHKTIITSIYDSSHYYANVILREVPLGKMELDLITARRNRKPT